MWDKTPVKVKECGSLKYWKKYLLLDNVKALERIIVSVDTSPWQLKSSMLSNDQQ